jgi:maltose/moltooligosaccharide transporter
MSNQNKYFSWGRVVLVCFIVASTELMWTLYNTYVPIWLQAGNPNFVMGAETTVTVGFGLGAFVTGLILTLDNIAGLFISPVIGLLSDTTRSRFGRRKPWIIFTMPVMIIAFILIPVFVMAVPPELNGQTEKLMPYLIPFVAMLVIMLLAYAVIRTPADVIMYDITPSKHRSMANAIANFIGAAFGVIASIIGAILFDVNPGLPFWVGAGLSSVVVSLVAVRITEPPIEEIEHGGETKRLSPKDTLAELKSLPKENQKSLALLYLSVFFSYFAFGQLGSFASSYGVSVLKMGVGDSGMLYAAGGAAFILGALPTGFILKRITRKQSSLIGFAAFALMGLVIYLFPSQAVVWPALAVGGFLWALVWVPQVPMVMDAVPSDRVLGSLEGMMAIARMLGYILGPLAGGFVVEQFGNDYSNIWLIVFVGSILGGLMLLPVTKGEVKTEASV